MKIDNKNDFGIKGHTPASEPYVYDAAYSLSMPTRQFAIPINLQGQCVLNREIVDVPFENLPTDHVRNSKTLMWKCYDECKPVSNEDIAAIVELKHAFEEPIVRLRRIL